MPLRPRPRSFRAGRWFGPALAVLASILFVSPIRAQVTSTFTTGLEGWLIIGDNSATWNSTGGNPGGALSVNDLATGQINYAAAPAAFLGDWSAAGAGDALSVDLWFVNSSGGALLTGDWLFRIAGPGGAAVALAPFPAPVQSAWTTYAVGLDSASWQMESGTWRALVAQVTSLKLLAEYVNGDEVVLFDNIRLSRTPTPVLAPCAVSTFDGTGTDDWSHENASVNNPGAGGTGGGFLHVTSSASQDGRSIALAPARFLGDWSALDGAASLVLDLRVMVAGTAAVGSPQFVRLSGPGGAAHVALAASDMPPPALLWKRLSFPLAAAAWTMESGTWAALLANVEEVRLDAELHTGGEQLGFDNFARLRNTCPPPDEPVVVHDPTVARCASHGFVGPGGLARNPVDGVMHVLARNNDSHDGAYRLSGPHEGRSSATYDRPAGIVFDHDGDGFVSEDYGGSIFRFAGTDTSSTWVSGLHSGDDDPFGMVIAPPGFAGPSVSPGDVLVTDRGNSGADEVWVFSPDVAEGERLLVPDPGNVDWYDIAASEDGRVWLADGLSGASLQRVAPDGSRTALTLAPPIAPPIGLAWDSVQDVLYASTDSPPAIHRIDPDDGSTLLVADGFAALAPAGLEVDAAKRRLWVSDRTQNRVYEFCLPGLPVAVPAGPAPAALAVRVSPNPARAEAVVVFELPRPAHVRVDVHDVAGRRVATLLDATRPAGTSTVRWDGRDGSGRAAAPGLYRVRVTTDEGSAARTVVVLH